MAWAVRVDFEEGLTDLFAAAFAGCFFAGDLMAVAVVLADLLEALLGREGAITSTPSGYQMYQMREGLKQLSALLRMISVVGCVIVSGAIR